MTRALPRAGWPKIEGGSVFRLELIKVERVDWLEEWGGIREMEEE